MLRSRVETAEVEACRAKEALAALEQQFARLQQEHSEAEKEIQALRTPKYSREFRMFDLQIATNNFHSSRKIGKGGYGPVYKGLLCSMPAAIKMLNPTGNQGRNQYQQEVINHSHIMIRLLKLIR